MVKTQTSRVSQNSKAKCPVLDRFHHPPLHHLHFGAKAYLKAPLWLAGMSTTLLLEKITNQLGKTREITVVGRKNVKCGDFMKISAPFATFSPPYRDEVETHGISRAFILISGTQNIILGK